MENEWNKGQLRIMRIRGALSLRAAKRRSNPDLETACFLPVIFHYPFIIFNSREARITRPSIRENPLLSGAIRGQKCFHCCGNSRFFVKPAYRSTSK
jgi:hypothetical protein